MVHELSSRFATFVRDYVHRERAWLDQLSSEGQRPATMFIGCSDSRVIPELLTSSSPGELFVVRNVANLVPPFMGAQDSVGAAVEFAVVALGVQHVVVCGHTGCGGVQAALNGLEGMENMPSTRSWLKLALPAAQAARGDTFERRWRDAVEENVLIQLDSLLTYPVVAEAVKAGSLDLHAWVYDIYAAELHVYNPATKRFRPPGFVG